MARRSLFVTCKGLRGRFLQFVSKLREVDDRSGNQVQLAREVDVYACIVIHY